MYKLRTNAYNHSLGFSVGGDGMLFPNLFRLFKGSDGVVIYPDSQWFVPVKGSAFDMPISWVWGPPRIELGGLNEPL